MPMPSLVLAAIRPATNVPWPWVSTVADPLTKLFAATMRPRSSGWLPSTPESITATLTAASGGGSVHASNDRFWAAYHCSRQERVVRDVRLPPAAERLDVPHTRHAAQRRRPARR